MGWRRGIGDWELGFSLRFMRSTTYVYHAMAPASWAVVVMEMEMEMEVGGVWKLCVCWGGGIERVE